MADTERQTRKTLSRVWTSSSLNFAESSSIKSKRFAEFRDDFPGPWEEVQKRFESTRRQIRDDDLDWHYVEGVGLTRSELVWKKTLLEKAARGRVLRRFLNMANSFLGSLTKPLPGVEYIKEFKEMVEATVTTRKKRCRRGMMAMVLGWNCR
jgi:hypothetical protein